MLLRGLVEKVESYSKTRRKAMLKDSLENIFRALDATDKAIKLNVMNSCGVDMVKRNVNDLSQVSLDLNRISKVILEIKEEYELLELLLELNRVLAHLHWILLQVQDVNYEFLQAIKKTESFRALKH